MVGPEEVWYQKEENNSSSEVVPQVSVPPYTTLSLHYRWYLTVLLGYTCLASSLTANIYFPLISLLADHYHASVQAINMTITLYLVIQGITPSFLAPISDSLGRRPVYLFSFTLYTVASLGLVFSGSSYIALIILRALQSIGGSATLALSYAMVADYTVHSERGRFLGPMMTATNIGPSIGPVIGRGVILATGEPRWALWTLVIFGSSALLLIAFTMRETNRSIVGNGSTSPRGFWRGYWDIFIAWNKGRCDRKSIRGQNHPENSINLDEDRTLSYTDVSSTTITGKGVFKIPNPFMSLKLLFYKDAFTVLYLAASPYASWYSISSSIPLIYGTEYGFNGLLVGCCYLAGGGGILAGGLIAGKLMDWNYKYAARNVGLSINRTSGDEISQFPIEMARSRGSYTILTISTFVFVGYGWVVQYRIHVAVPLLMQFYLGGKCTILHQIYSALLVDIFPGRSGTVGASNNICRCAASAVVVAILQPLVERIGRSWFFTLIGLLDGAGSIIGVYVLRRWMAGWRQDRLSRELDLHVTT